MSERKGGRLVNETVEVTNVHSNLSQEVIEITTDRLRLILNEHISLLEGRKEWIAPFGLLITLIIVFSTTSFKEAIFPADTWQAMFIMLTILVFCWLVRSFYRVYNAPSVKDIIEKIKKGG